MKCLIKQRGRRLEYETDRARAPAIPICRVDRLIRRAIDRVQKPQPGDFDFGLESFESGADRNLRPPAMNTLPTKPFAILTVDGIRVTKVNP